jgi:predicted nucleic acid-binding protein
MTVALDTNVLQALLQRQHPLQSRAIEALQRHQPRNRLTISPFVYAEAHGIPNFQHDTFLAFLRDLGADIDLNPPEGMWPRAGEAHAAYHERRRRHGHTEPKRVLADFLIGAHAVSRNMALLTFDPLGYRAAFPELQLLSDER